MNHFEGKVEATGPLPWEHMQPVFLIAGVGGAARPRVPPGGGAEGPGSAGRLPARAAGLAASG